MGIERRATFQNAETEVAMVDFMFVLQLMCWKFVVG